MIDETERPGTPYAAIGRRLLLTRTALGKKTQTDFIKGLRIKHNTYAEWEGGKRRLSLNGALMLCKAYDLSLDWLYRDKVGSLENLPLQHKIRDLRLRQR